MSASDARASAEVALRHYDELMRAQAENGSDTIARLAAACVFWELRALRQELSDVSRRRPK